MCQGALTTSAGTKVFLDGKALQLWMISNMSNKWRLFLLSSRWDQPNALTIVVVVKLLLTICNCSNLLHIIKLIFLEFFMIFYIFIILFV